MNFIQLQVAYPVPHPIFIASEYITAVEENRINENSKGSIVHLGESAFIVDEYHLDILERL
jgi:hypothetical protein